MHSGHICIVISLNPTIELITLVVLYPVSPDVEPQSNRFHHRPFHPYPPISPPPIPHLFHLEKNTYSMYHHPINKFLWRSASEAAHPQTIPTSNDDLTNNDAYASLTHQVHCHHRQRKPLPGRGQRIRLIPGIRESLGKFLIPQIRQPLIITETVLELLRRVQRWGQKAWKLGYFFYLQPRIHVLVLPSQERI